MGASPARQGPTIIQSPSSLGAKNHFFYLILKNDATFHLIIVPRSVTISISDASISPALSAVGLELLRMLVLLTLIQRTFRMSIAAWLIAL